MDAGTVFSGVSTVIIAGGVIFAGLQVREARTSREEQSRPFVIAYFTPTWLTYFVVENIGSTIARDVSLTFTPALESTLTDADVLDAPALSEGIPTLAPGQKLRFLFDTAPERMANEA